MVTGRDARGRFVAGSSGNPAGRPAAGSSLVDWLRQVGDMRREGRKVARIEELAVGVWDGAIEGKPWAAALLFRAMGGLQVEGTLTLSGVDEVEGDRRVQEWEEVVRMRDLLVRFGDVERVLAAVEAAAAGGDQRAAEEGARLVREAEAELRRAARELGQVESVGNGEAV